MSINAYQWVWRLDLPSRYKFLLMAIAQYANDNGKAWPSVRSLSNCIGRSERTVQRQCVWLKQQGYIDIQPRHNSSGGQTSNSIELLMPSKAEIVGNYSEAGFKKQGASSMSPGGDKHVREGVTSMSSGGDTRDTQTNNELSFNPLQPLQQHAHQALLIWPTAFNSSMRVDALRLLQGFSDADAQEILDELGGRMTINKVRNPLGYLRKLSCAKKNGQFMPELVGRGRQMRTQMQSVHSSAVLSSARQACESDGHGREQFEKLKQRLGCKQ